MDVRIFDVCSLGRGFNLTNGKAWYEKYCVRQIDMLAHAQGKCGSDERSINRYYARGESTGSNCQRVTFVFILSPSRECCASARVPLSPFSAVSIGL